MYSRYFQPLGLKRRLPLSDDTQFAPAHTLRYVEVLAALRDEPAPPLELQLRTEKADIDLRARRFDTALSELDACTALAASLGRDAERRLAFQRGRAEYAAGNLDEAERALLRVAAAPTPDEPLAGRAALHLGRVQAAQGRFAEAVDTLETALASPGVVDGDRLAGLYDLVYACAHEGDFDTADATLAIAAGVVGLDDSLGRARLAYYRSWVAFARRHIDQAAALVDDAIREFHLQRDAVSLACAELMRACVDFERADLPACIDRCDRVTQGDVGRSDIAIAFLLLRGLALLVAGRTAEAETECRRAERLSRQSGSDAMTAWTLRWRADIHAFAGDLAAAQTALETALAMYHGSGDALGEAMTLTVLGRVLRNRGDARASADTFEQARSLAEGLDNRWELANLDAEEMEAAFLRGEVDAAEEKALSAAATYRALGDRVRLSRMCKHLAQIAAVRDDFDRAQALFAEALDLLAGDPNRILHAEVLDSRAEAHADSGNADAALRDLHAALDLVQPTGAVLLAGAISNHVAQVRERHAAQAVLSRYMEPKIVSRLLSRGPRRLAANVEQEASILFSDVRGFTNLTERLGPHEVVDLLNCHFEAMTEEIVALGGTIDKFIGDAVMAVFGDPGRPRPDDAERCVRAAKAMQLRRSALNVEAIAKGQTPLSIGIGVATGNVVMGNLGSARRMTYTVIGDAVNVASRLETMTKDAKRSVLIDAATRAKLPGDLAVVELGDFAVKGRAGLVPVYALELA
ncbi:MAG: tetratricopeptide repeat protein [Deltaproteobacteria bacterium]|nr:tetratricopeptide repeat protein [Deltaproteobacteria bacterium]